MAIFTAGYFTCLHTLSIMPWSSYGVCKHIWELKNKNILSQAHALKFAKITLPAHRHQQAPPRVKKETHIHTFTSHTVVHKVIWASHGGVDYCSRQYSLLFIQPQGVWLGRGLEPCREKLLNRTARSKGSERLPQPVTFSPAYITYNGQISFMSEYCLSKNTVY